MVGLLLTFVLGPGALGLACAPILLPELWLADVAEQGEPLVAAIRRYEAEHGQPPEQLEVLVPSYLTAIPETGYAGPGEWWYRRCGGGWQLCATIDGMALDFDEFRYEPSGSLAVPIGYRYVARHGDWLYMDE